MTGTLNIVLIEDDEIDGEIFARDLAATDIPYRLTRFFDGQSALLALKQAAELRLKAFPSVIFLDLCLPGMNGFEFLDQIHKDPALETAVVFVISGASNDRIKAEASSRHISGYLEKDQLGRKDGHLAAILRPYWQAAVLSRSTHPGLTTMLET